MFVVGVTPDITSLPGLTCGKFTLNQPDTISQTIILGRYSIHGKLSSCPLLVRLPLNVIRVFTQIEG